MLLTPPAERVEATPQTVAESGWALAAARIEIGAAERAARGERTHALTAGAANMGSVGHHIEQRTTYGCAAAYRWLNDI
jgi:hypothetical protein